MTTRFEDKDPSDVVTLTFDFSELASAVTTPVISVSAYEGEDAAASAILMGLPTVDGALVRQRVQAGVAGVTYLLQCRASAGGDTYSIEALLPIVVRPAAFTGSPVYVTPSAYEARFGAQELTDLLADGAAFTQAENDAAGLVNGYVAARYSLPLVSVPPMVVGWTADILRHKLWAERAPDEVRRRYDDAIAQLRDVARGLVALPAGADGTAAAGALVFGGYSALRVFDEDTLAGF